MRASGLHLDAIERFVMISLVLWTRTAISVPQFPAVACLADAHTSLPHEPISGHWSRFRLGGMVEWDLRIFLSTFHD